MEQPQYIGTVHWPYAADEHPEESDAESDGPGSLVNSSDGEDECECNCGEVDDDEDECQWDEDGWNEVDHATLMRTLCPLEVEISTPVDATSVALPASSVTDTSSRVCK